MVVMTFLMYAGALLAFVQYVLKQWRPFGDAPPCVILGLILGGQRGYLIFEALHADHVFVSEELHQEGYLLELHYQRHLFRQDCYRLAVACLKDQVFCAIHWLLDLIFSKRT
jgi:hypothetical protein